VLIKVSYPILVGLIFSEYHPKFLINVSWTIVCARIFTDWC